MKRFTLILLLALFVATVANAQSPAPADKDVSQWIKDVREYKHSFLAKELGLSREQQNKFFKVYDAMDDEIAQLNSDTRRMEKRISDMKGEDVSDLEYDAATDALFNLKAKEAEIELEYLPQLREVLTRQQLFNLKNAERKLTMTLMRRHHELRGRKK